MTNHSIDKFKNRRHDLKKERGERMTLLLLPPTPIINTYRFLVKFGLWLRTANFRSADRWRVGFPLYNLREMGELTRNFQDLLCQKQGPLMNSYIGHSGAARSMGPAKKSSAARSERD